jgi:predicted heme/steroid binding protein
MAFSTFNTFGSLVTKKSIKNILDILWYKMDSTTFSGTTLINAASSGSINNGTFYSSNGTITTDTTKHIGTYSSSLLFVSTGNSSYYVVNSPLFTLPSNTIGNGFTFSFWYHQNSSQQAGSRLLTWGVGGSGSTSTETNTNVISWYTAGGNGETYINYNGNFVNLNTAPSYNQWHHIALVVTSNGGSGLGSATSTHYVDGIPINGFQNFQDYYPTTGQSNSLAFCHHAYNINFQDIKVYGTPLSSQNIAALYSSGTPILN